MDKTLKDLNKKQRKSVVSIVKSVSNSVTSKKYLNRASIGVSSSWARTCLTDVATGTTVIDRTGNRIVMTNVWFRYNLVLADTTNLVRVILFIWFPDDGSDAPDEADLLTDTVSQAREVLAPFIPTKPSRFKVIYDETTALDAAHVNVCKTFKKKLSYPVRYNTGASTGQGHLYLVTVSDSTAVAHPAFGWESLVQYTDG